VTLQWPPPATSPVRGDGETQEAPAPASEVRTVDAAPRPDLLHAGEILGSNYEVREKLGEGGMGQVFEALDRALARRVAIKVAHADTRGSVVQEARALAALRHPGIVAVYALGTHDGKPYVVMERLHGKTLEAVLDEHRARGSWMPIEEAVDLLAAVADALGAVHRAGMAHRDVKPANVMLAAGGRVVLTDFGIFQPEVVRDPSLAGSPHYIAPEVIQARVALGELYLVDVYAFGVVAYETLAGRVPFDDAHVMKVLYRHVTEPPADLAAQRGDVPAKLAALVLDMLAKDPKSRPQSMDEIAWQLRRLRAQPARADTRCSVVVAEDNPATGAILTSMVSEIVPDADVRLARDGWAALEMVKRRPPDLFIVDVDLPVLDGLGVCERLRGTAVARTCTVVATSSHATPAQTARLREMGFAFVPKGAELARKLPALVKRARRASGSC
jgi:CheY-like chemotaxis protein/predicted Ser/Thr protein kinase